MPTSDRTVPEARIFVNNTQLPVDLRADVLDIVVTQHVEGGDSFEITFNTLDSNNQRLKWNDSTLLAPGSVLEVEVGYQGNYDSLIVGEITGLRAEYPNDDAATLVVQGFDRLHRLRRGRRTRAFYSMKDSQVAEKIAQDLQLTADVEDTSVVHRYLLQANVSDIDFLLDRARRIWYEVRVVDKKLFFRRAANNLAAVATLTYQQDLMTFSARLSSARQVSEVRVRGWNPSAKAAILGVGHAGDETTRMGGATLGPVLAEQAFGVQTTAVVHTPVRSQAEAEQIARARYNDIALEWLTAEGEAVGTTAIRAGRTVKIQAVGRRFSGIYYVRRAEHRVSPDAGYVTCFSCVRNAS